jgi:hypothetical protein
MKLYEFGNTDDECEEDPTEMGDHSMTKYEEEEEDDVGLTC